MELVTVIVPTFNRKKRLIRALSSIFAQSYTNIEVIIVDDGSTDGTEDQVYKIFEENLSKIKYIKQKESRGAAVARNKGIKNSNGKYIAFLDSDDEWKNNHIEKGLKVISETKADGVFGWFDMIFNNNKKIKKEFDVFKNENTSSDYVFSRIGDPRTSTFIMKENMIKNILFDESLKKHQDWDLFIRFANEYKISTMTESTVYIHIDEEDKIRMSSKKNYNLEATEYFIQKHENKASDRPLAHFYYRVSMGLLKTSSNSKKIKNYNKKMLSKGGKSYLVKYLILSVLNTPFINVEFVSDVYRKNKYR